MWSRNKKLDLAECKGIMIANEQADCNIIVLRSSGVWNKGTVVNLHCISELMYVVKFTDQELGDQVKNVPVKNISYLPNDTFQKLLLLEQPISSAQVSEIYNS